MAGPLAQRFEAQPLASAGGRVITSPFQFITTGEDHLRILSFNSAAGVRLKIRGRVVPVNGPLEPLERDHVPTTDRSVVSSIIPLQAGAVLNVTVFAASGAPVLGQTFVIVQLIRGLSASAIVIGTLLQGYVTAQQHLAWPGSPIQTSIESGGAIRTIIGTAPAAGVEWLETVPTGARWQLLHLKALLSTSAAPGTRRVVLATREAGNDLLYYPAFQAYAAGLQHNIVWGQNLNGNIDAVQGVTTTAIAPDTILLAGQSFRSITNGIDAGDQWSAPAYDVREWLEVN